MAEVERRFVPLKINVYKQQQEAREFGIRDIPVVVLWGTSEQIVHLEGFIPPDQLVQQMKSIR